MAEIDSIRGAQKMLFVSAAGQTYICVEEEATGMLNSRMSLWFQLNLCSQLVINGFHSSAARVQFRTLV
jgi:hypothetical protein